MFSLQHTNKKLLLGVIVVAIAAVASFFATNITLAQTPDTRPNIVIFLADDGGFSDFLAGEVDTPNIDSLADSGIMLTQFRTMPTCTPARAVLMSGMDNHIAGVGAMQGYVNGPSGIFQRGQPGYEGYLNKNVVTIATLLQDAGYHTYMVGKWHLGLEEEPEEEQVIFPRGWWPIDRGFEMSAGMLEGGAEHYGSCERASAHCTRFFENDRIVTEELAPDYFSAEYHTDKAIEFINAGIDADAGERKPFFLYYSDTLVHEPNQVPEEYIPQALVDELYNKGWDTLRAERLTQLQAMGIISDSVTLPARYSDVPAWGDVNDPNWSTGFTGQTLVPFMTDETYGHIWGDDGEVTTVDDVKMIMAKKFATYLGMVSYFDNEVGRIMQHMKDIGEYDNSVFIFFNDNGGDSRPWDYLDRDMLSRKGTDNSVDNIGNKNSFVANGQPWAQVSNAPLDQAKGLMGDAGVRSPLIMLDTRQAAGRAGSMSTALATVMDIAPTILDYAGVTHPVGVGVSPDAQACTGTYDGRTDICPMNGKSIRGIVEGTVDNVHIGEPIGWELAGLVNQALFLEEEDALYKIRRVNVPGLGPDFFTPPFQSRSVQLFNVTEDPTESNDLAASNPEKLKMMIDMYQQYLANVGFVGSAPVGTVDRTFTTENIANGETLMIEIPLSNSTGMDDMTTVKCMSAWECDVEILLADRSDARGSDNVTFNLADGLSVTARIHVTAPADAQNGDMAKTYIFINSENNPGFPQNQTHLTTVEGVPTAITSALLNLVDGNRQVVFLAVALLIFVTVAARAWNVRVSIDPRD